MASPDFNLDLPALKSRFAQVRRFIDPETLGARLAEIEAKMAEPDFWNDSRKAQEFIGESNRIKAKIVPLKEIDGRIADLAVLAELVADEPTEAAQKDLEIEALATIAALDAYELKVLLSGELDPNNAIISIHAGAGGTEACDWANMMLRMYQRYAERNGFKTEMLDMLPGEEAGVKACTLLVKGEYAYGYLKAERGVHRLVRISPFNSQGKRQTSFSSLDVIAEVDDTINIEIPESDIRVDVYRAGGHGGQGVNTTDSAVRITHMPSGLVVTCQNERSQIKNRASAMNVLKSRLYELEQDKQRADMEKYYGEKGEIGWGRQIRSYVLQPYQMVKDLRTGEQTGDVQAVLDGEITPFIEAYLRGKKRTDIDPDDE
ncbi:bacterial peptide chain release factor 2 (bRF-2) [Verrucomicrobium sp. GAS474]|uniref:peptide chain release factor 2 n=1 Tax=Verrucomicrobium sp. GAS474 TaxID=1882831 RepID=UPI0008797FC5|nr:peptide chain release factor 2 [Verrucomicrobium sp. GAS474]SDU16744.1 bacterial peptide chain release factor 2 (bRF-2) [Verrucomicrobium sp. GAS474]